MTRPKKNWPKAIDSPGLRGAVQEVLQSKSHKRLMRLLGLLQRARTTTPGGVMEDKVIDDTNPCPSCGEPCGVDLNYETLGDDTLKCQHCGTPLSANGVMPCGASGEPENARSATVII
jgi:hypothetical protein